MEYYYTSSNYQNYPSNYPYNYNQPSNDFPNNNNYYYNSSSYDHEYGVTGYSNYYDPNPYDQHTQFHSVTGYSNDYTPNPYDQHTQFQSVAGYSNNYNPNPYDQRTQFHSNPYEHFPAQSMTVYQYNSSYDQPLDELPSKKGTNFLDPVSTTGFVISYSNTEIKPDLKLEKWDLGHYQGGYCIEEAYGKSLPPSDEICYPRSKIDSISPIRQDSKSKEDEEHNKEENRGVKLAEEEKGEESVEDKDEEDEDNEEENRGVKEAEEEKGEESEENEEDEDNEEENRGVLVALPIPVMGNQGIKETEEEEEKEEEFSSSDESEKTEEEKTVEEQEKEIKRQIPAGYGLGSMDWCEGVFGGYFPCLRKKLLPKQGSNSEHNEDFDGWKITADYLFGDPDPYARAFPDPIYGYHRYYPQQPISGQIVSAEDHHSWMDNSSYYNYGY